MHPLGATVSGKHGATQATVGRDSPKRSDHDDVDAADAYPDGRGTRDSDVGPLGPRSRALARAVRRSALDGVESARLLPCARGDAVHRQGPRALAGGGHDPGSQCRHRRRERGDEHLRSTDFLDVERYPEITYRSTRVRPGDGDKWYVAELLVNGGFSFFGGREAKARRARARPCASRPWRSLAGSRSDRGRCSEQARPAWCEVEGTGQG